MKDQESIQISRNLDSRTKKPRLKDQESETGYKIQKPKKPKEPRFKKQ